MDFLKVVTGFVEDAVDFGGDLFDFGGTDVLDLPDELQYTQGMSGSSFSGFGEVIDYAGGFLSSDLGKLVKKGAGMYLDSQKEDTKYKAIKNPRFERPDLIRGRNQQTTPSRAQPRNPVGLNNAAVRGAMQRMASRPANFSPQLQRIVEANMTARQGRRTIGLGTTSLARVTPAAAASVRKLAKETT